jgi:hypothetical protein
VAALLILVALGSFCALLAKPYYQNWKLQQHVEQIAFDPVRQSLPPEAFLADVAEQAARLGLPVSMDQIRVTKSEAGVYIEARYFVRIDLFLYTVDLHFRPSAGAR